MWLVRIGTRGRWCVEDPESGTYLPRGNSHEDVCEAAKDLRLREGEPGLSVFRVSDEAEAALVARYFGATVRDDPQNTDYVLLSESTVAAAELDVQPVRDNTGLHPYLRERYHQVFGLDNTGAVERLAAQALAGVPPCSRVKKKDLVDWVKAEVSTDPELKGWLKPRWQRLL